MPTRTRPTCDVDLASLMVMELGEPSPVESTPVRAASLKATSTVRLSSVKRSPPARRLLGKQSATRIAKAPRVNRAHTHLRISLDVLSHVFAIDPSSSETLALSPAQQSANSDFHIFPCFRNIHCPQKADKGPVGHAVAVAAPSASISDAEAFALALACPPVPAGTGHQGKVADKVALLAATSAECQRV